jgi:hypothetical protein
MYKSQKSSSFEYKHHLDFPSIPSHITPFMLHHIIPSPFTKMPRTIYLAIFSNSKFKPAHWALWLLNPNHPQTGKLIHVTGNPATGFFLEFARNYNLENESRIYQVLPLAQVDDKLVGDARNVDGGESRDTTARDRIESVATVVRPLILLIQRRGIVKIGWAMLWRG